MPDVVKNAYIKAIKNDKTSYSHNKGLFETRKLLANILNENIISFIVRKKSSLLMVRVKH